MVARWFVAMQDLHFTVVFVPGTSNVLADALSRLCPNLTQMLNQQLTVCFRIFGSPNMIRSDRGSHFANEMIKEFLDLCGTPHNLTLAYSKQENEIVDRVNKEVPKRFSFC